MSDERRIHPLKLAELTRAACEGREFSPEHAYVRDRVRDAHDLFHTLTGYGIDLLGEAGALSFTFAKTGNKGWASLVLLNHLTATKRLRFDGWVVAWKAYRRGRLARYLPAVEDRDRLLRLPIEDARRELGIAPMAPYRPPWLEDVFDVAERETSADEPGRRRLHEPRVGGAERDGPGVELVDALPGSAGDRHHLAVAGSVGLLVVGDAEGEHRLVHAGPVELDAVHAEQRLRADLGGKCVVEGDRAVHVAGCDRGVAKHVGAPGWWGWGPQHFPVAGTAPADEGTGAASPGPARSRRPRLDGRRRCFALRRRLSWHLFLPSSEQPGRSSVIRETCACRWRPYSKA
jgi:hypothetical protein